MCCTYVWRTLLLEENIVDSKPLSAPECKSCILVEVITAYQNCVGMQDISWSSYQPFNLTQPWLSRAGFGQLFQSVCHNCIIDQWQSHFLSHTLHAIVGTSSNYSTSQPGSRLETHALLIARGYIMPILYNELYNDFKSLFLTSSRRGLSDFPG